MDRSGFVTRAPIAFALVMPSLFLRGFSQFLVGRDVAELLQAPFAVAGFLLLVYLFCRATRDAVGIWDVEQPDP